MDDFVAAHYAIIKNDATSNKALPTRPPHRYQPKALGTHRTTMQLELFSSSGFRLAPLAIQMAGTSLFVADKPALVGGTTVLPHDFHREPKELTNDVIEASIVKATNMKQRQAKSYWDGPEATQLMGEAFDGTTMK